jgi:hypothetical protein
MGNCIKIILFQKEFPPIVSRFTYIALAAIFERMLWNVCVAQSFEKFVA